MKKIIDLYPEAPCVWLWREHELETKIEFYPSVSVRIEDEPLWHECEDRYKEGYDLLWSLRQEEHTADERQALEEQYASWQTANPDLVEEIDASVPVKPEPEQEPSQS